MTNKNWFYVTCQSIAVICLHYFDGILLFFDTTHFDDDPGKETESRRKRDEEAFFMMNYEYWKMSLKYWGCCWIRFESENRLVLERCSQSAWILLVPFDGSFKMSFSLIFFVNILYSTFMGDVLALNAWSVEPFKTRVPLHRPFPVNPCVTKNCGSSLTALINSEDVLKQPSSFRPSHNRFKFSLHFVNFPFVCRIRNLWIRHRSVHLCIEMVDKNRKCSQSPWIWIQYSSHSIRSNLMLLRTPWKVHRTSICL